MIPDNKKQLVFPILLFIGMAAMIAYIYLPRFVDTSKKIAEKIPESKNIDTIEVPLAMEITSSAFKNGDKIPKKYTCKGEDVNPPLLISNVPKGTKSLVLIIEDPDSPLGVWDHWIVYDINPDVRVIEENSVPPGGRQGLNDFGKGEYGGPCPGSGEHRYYFKILALSKKLNFRDGVNKDNLINEIYDFVLDKAELMGRFSKYDDVVLTK